MNSPGRSRADTIVGPVGDNGQDLPAPPAGTPPAQGLSYVPYRAAPSGLSFPTPLAVDLAAGLVDAAPGWTDPTHGYLRRFALEVGPGLVRALTHTPGYDTRDDTPVRVRADDCLDSGCPLVVAISPPDRSPLGQRGRVLHWSAKSRTNMVKKMTSLDWSPVVDAGAGWRPVMITLTYPGDWLAVAPDGATVKEHLKSLCKRWRREWGRDLACVWKLEFQRRGAPHFHLYCAAPVGQTFRDWLSRAWYEIVGSGDERHLHAGTGIDWGEGLRASDPKRLGIYFAKRAATHNVAESKEYQHIVPVEWREEGKGPGRFWGVRKLSKATAVVELDDVQFVQLRRLMRRYLASQGRTREVRRRIVDQDTGEVRAGRKVTRRYALRSLSAGRMTGGFLLLNDAPRWLSQAARWDGLRTGA